MTEPLLELRNVGASYGGRSVLHDISFAVGEGRVSTLLGANGAGKTTTLRAICTPRIGSSARRARNINGP
jgi:branched-chain amino acid transport system ATP-binding protein